MSSFINYIFTQFNHFLANDDFWPLREIPDDDISSENNQQIEFKDEENIYSDIPNDEISSDNNQETDFEVEKVHISETRRDIEYNILLDINYIFYFLVMVSFCYFLHNVYKLTIEKAKLASKVFDTENTVLHM